MAEKIATREAYGSALVELAEKYEARMREKQSLMGKLEEKKNDVVRESHLRRNQDIGCRRIQGGSLCL